MRFFIRTKEQEGFVEAETLQDAFVLFVEQTPISQLGLLLLGHTEYFPYGVVPGESVGCRVTIPLVKAGIWSEEQAKDFNEEICGERIV